MKRLLLDAKASVHVEPEEFDIPFDPDTDESGAWVISPSHQKKLDAAFVPLPAIWIYWAEFTSRDGVRMPLLEKPTPIARRRGKSVNAVELEDLIRELSGPERERERGYAETLVEQRATPEGLGLAPHRQHHSCSPIRSVTRYDKEADHAPGCLIAQLRWVITRAPPIVQEGPPVQCRREKADQMTGVAKGGSEFQ